MAPYGFVRIGATSLMGFVRWRRNTGSGAASRAACAHRTVQFVLSVPLCMERLLGFHIVWVTHQKFCECSADKPRMPRGGGWPVGRLQHTWSRRQAQGQGPPRDVVGGYGAQCMRLGPAYLWLVRRLVMDRQVWQVLKPHGTQPPKDQRTAVLCSAVACPPSGLLCGVITRLL